MASFQMETTSAPALDFFAVTPHNSNNFSQEARGLYVGTTGNIAAVTRAGTAVVFVAVPAGMILPIKCIRVNSTNTTATDIVGLA